MTITQTVLNDIFKSFSARFNAGYNAEIDPADRESLRLEDFAMTVPSTGTATDHTWLGQLPAMRKWEDTRTIKALTMGKITVVNEPWEATVELPRTAIEDDSFGMFGNLIEGMGTAARELWLDLAVKALTANGNWADGNPFFCSGRKLSENVTLTNGVETAFSPEAVETAIGEMRGWKLEEGRAANVLPKRLVVAPGLASTARRICNSELIATATGGTESNPLRGIIDYRICNSLPAGAWYLFGEVAGVKAVAVQQRKLPVLTRMDHEKDENVFMKNTIYYGTDARGEAFLTLPFLAYAGGMTSVPAWAEV